MGAGRDHILNGLAGTDVAGGGPVDPALVMLHSLTFSRRTWTGVCAAMAGRFRCLALDLPGHGDSPPADRFRTIPDIAGQVAGALREAGVGRAIVVGNSFGGSVGVALADGNPDLVAGLALVGAAVWDGEPDRRAWLQSRASAFFTTAGAIREPGPEVVEELFGTCDEDLYGMVLADHRAAADALPTCLWALYAYDVAHGLAAAAQRELPVLSVYGSRDPYREQSTAVIRKYKGRLDEVVVSGGSHVLPVDKPAELAAAVSGWVRGIAGGRP